jgi:hypothetical protein
MAIFVGNAPFDARAASASFYNVFVEGNISTTLGENGTGFDGVTYPQYVLVDGANDLGTFQLALGGEFTISVTPTGTVDYLSVAQGENPLFYFSELNADIATFQAAILAPIEDGVVHPAILQALAGDDQITLSNGTDYFDAGTGFDQSNYAGARDDYTVQESEGGQLVVEAVAVEGDVDTLDNVEKLTFSDGSLIFDLDSNNADFAYRIYAAAYGRTPDEAGLRFWTGVLDERGEGPPDVDDKEFIASFFLTADEFIDVYGENSTDEEYINGLYLNVLKREADQGGYDFWLNQLESGQGRDDLLIFFTDSDENVANTAPDVDNGLWVL